MNIAEKTRKLVCGIRMFFIPALTNMCYNLLHYGYIIQGIVYYKVRPWGHLLYVPSSSFFTATMVIIAVQASLFLFCDPSA